MRPILSICLCLICCVSIAPGYADDGVSQCDTWTAESLSYAAQKESIATMNAKSPKERLAHAKKGLEWGKKCVTSFPNEAACYYYRGLNQAFIVETTLLSFQKKLVAVVEDMQRAIRLNPKVDAGGPYRVIGNIYLKAPEFAVKKHAIVRDLDRALKYALQATSVDQQDVDNRLLLAEVHVARGKKDLATPLLAALVDDYPQKRPYTLKDRDRYRDIKRLYARTSGK